MLYYNETKGYSCGILSLVHTFTPAAELTSHADRYSDDVRAEVGVPSEQLELLANCIEKYSEAAMGAHPAAWSALKKTL